MDPTRPARHWRVTSRAVLTARLALVLFLSLCPGALASASTFTVDRVQIFLSARAKSDGLTVKNVSADTLRFQLSVFAWDQTSQGEMVLASTQDVVFFPQLFTLAPGEERHVRIGSATSPAASEKTYRLFVEELPPAAGGPSGSPPGEVTLRTRLGIPIFLRPPKEATGGRVETLALQDARLSFAVRNTGTVHFVVQGIAITGYGAAGDVVTQATLEGWYILAGGARRYELQLPADKCPAIKAVSVEVRTAQATFTERLELTPNACRP